MSSSRSWSLGYLLARYVDALAVSARASQAGKSFSEAVSAGVSAALAPRLTRVVFHAGTAMAPTLNGGSPSSAAAATAVASAARKKAATAAAAATTAATATATAAAATATASATTKTPPPPAPPLPPVEGLLVRVLRSPDAASVRVGDVVAFSAPAVSSDEERAVGAWPSEGQASVLVRRVAASEGEELLVDADGEDKKKKEKSSSSSSSTTSPSTFSVPRGHCWVLADNEALPISAARDSRAFGPLPYGAVLGRVVYAAASITDHRPIPRGGGGAGSKNNGSSGAFDEALLEAELDVGELAPPAPVA